MHILFSLCLSFFVSFLSAFYIRKLALKFNILDLPDSRKIHHKSVPLLGGLSVYLGVIAGVAINPEILLLFSSVLLGGTLILIVSLIDDIRGLSAQFRLFIQLLAALIIIGSGNKISFLPPGPWGDMVEIIITIIWIVGITNAFNCLDGLDGLCAGLSLISSIFFGTILFSTGQNLPGILTLTVGVSCLGFLPHNLKKNKMFLGDAGSTFIGFMFAGISLVGDWAEANVVKIAIPILILGVPIFDMIFTTILRIKEKKIEGMISWLKYSDKDHFHHYLVDLGFKPLSAVLFILFAGISLGISALIVDKAIEGFLSLIQALIILGMIAIIMVAGKIRKREVK